MIDGREAHAHRMMMDCMAHGNRAGALYYAQEAERLQRHRARMPRVADHAEDATQEYSPEAAAGLRLLMVMEEEYED